jgi:hypothetical protein
MVAFVCGLLLLVAGFLSLNPSVRPITTVLGLSNKARSGTPPKDSKALSKARMSGSTFSLGTVATCVQREYLRREAKKWIFSPEPSG